MTKKQLAKRAKKILQQLEKAKPLYAKLDEVTLRLKLLGFKKDEDLMLIDNFAESNTVFRPAAIKRFELRWRKK